MVKKTITLSHGNGGEENNQLIESVFYKAFKNEILEKSEDASIIENGKLAFCTDSFTISPIFFAGGDIGKISICGTCNDLAMMGAKPKYITVAVIIEEGFALKDLEKIVQSMKKELAVNGAIVVSGDTKVMPRGTLDKIIINTSGIGEVAKSGISANTLSEDDVILVSRDIGCHGASLFALREGIDMDVSLDSDCASLFPTVEALINANIGIKAMRDATRGGVSAVLNEWSKQSDVCVEIQEDTIPVSDEVSGMCEILGLEPTSLANEGTFVLAVQQQDEQKALEILRSFNQNATVIGRITSRQLQRVLLISSYGTMRYLDIPMGELLPRIC